MSAWVMLLLGFVSASFAHAQDTGSQAREHVPPEPPARVMPDMRYEEMTSAMQMDDAARIGALTLDRLEWRGASDRNVFAWDARATYGGDYHKLILKSEGEFNAGQFDDARAELFWNRIVARFWSAQLGVREDIGGAPRSWLALGVEGLAPYWIDVDATLYLADSGRTAARIRADRDWLFTQRFILGAHFEANFYGQPDRERHLGAGLATIDTGLRIRYEIRREFAPYLGVAWRRAFAGTADLVRQSGRDVDEAQWVLGVRMWF